MLIRVCPARGISSEPVNFGRGKLAGVTAAVLGLAAGLAIIPASASAAPGNSTGKRAVVLVSGTAATTPFTTPTRACRSGYGAGNTWTFLRNYLKKEGYRVFTAPASVGGQKVVETDSPYDGPFGDCPTQLPSSMTINGIGSVDRSGSSLQRFVRFLNRKYRITSVDLVGHSLGGMIGRAGIRELRLEKVPVTVRSYTTVGSPWEGTFLAAPPPDPNDPASVCDGLAVCEAFITSLLSVPGIYMLVSYLAPANESVWNSNQKGFLKGIPVTLIAGDYFTKDGGASSIWPNDAIINKSSALAEATPNDVLPYRRCFSFPLTHSLSVSRAQGIADDTALTWNRDVGEAIAKGIDRAKSALTRPNRIGCPDAP